MRPHPFRPLDAVLGLAVIAVGILVAVFDVMGFENLDEDNVFIWLVIAAGILGLSLLPWPHRQAREPAAPPAPEPAWEAELEAESEEVSSRLPDESSPDA